MLSLQRVLANEPPPGTGAGVRSALRSDLGLAALVGLAVGAGFLVFGGRAMGAPSRIWSDNVLPACLDMYLNGLPMC